MFVKIFNVLNKFVCYLLKLVDVRDDGFMLKPMVMVVGSPYKTLID